MYAGFGLILLALICLPAKLRVVYGVDVDIIYVGPVFALLVGVWSFPNLILGIIQSSSIMSKKAVLLGFALTLSLANIVLALMVWQYVRFPYTDTTPFLLPCMIADVVGLCYFARSEKVVSTLRNPKIRILLVIVLTAFPLLVVGGNLLQGAIFY
nr:hypothetical protein [Candidatus Njordarchaeota archaeon]